MKERIQINEKSIITRKAGMDTTDLDGEKVMMDLDKGQYFMMNEVGSRIWDIVEKPLSYEEVVNVLLSEYTVEEAECRETVKMYLSK